MHLRVHVHLRVHTCIINMHMCGQAHALLVRPLFLEMMPTIDAVLMPRGGGHGDDHVELDDH